jgi:hypothetical protein
MKRVTKVAAAVTVGVAVVAGTGAAVAAETHTAKPMSYHTGRTGCFTWSWSDGDITTQVYYHNTCNHPADIGFSFRFEIADLWYTVGPNQKGRRGDNGAILKIMTR